jgi:hypothetical protein
MKSMHVIFFSIQELLKHEVCPQICRWIFRIFDLIYCDRFAEGIVGQQPSGHVPAHAPRNSTVEVFSLCLRMDRCYTTHVWWRHTTVCRDHMTCAFCDSRWHYTTVAITWNVFLWFAVMSHNNSGHITCFLWCVSVPWLYKKVPSIIVRQLAVRDSHGKFVVEEELEVALWWLNVWFEDFMCAVVQWYQESLSISD